MAGSCTSASEPSPIDPAMLERMGRIARGLPGRTVSVVRAAGSQGSAQHREIYAPPTRSRDIVVEARPVLRIDGVVAAEIIRCCERDGAG